MAKNTKKFQGQGQRTALLRTDHLEAKDWNAQGQGTRTQRGSDFQKKGLRSKILEIFRKIQAFSKKK